MPTPSPTLTYSAYLPLVMGGCGYLIDGRIVPPTKYYSFNGRRIAMREGCNGAVTYFYHDSLGSTVATSEGESTRYWPYGSALSGDVGTDYRYTGQRLDSYINLYGMGARWYDAQLGRWLSPDTIVPEPGDPQSLNRYSYVLSSPLRYTDPSGHDPLDDAWGASFRAAHGRDPNDDDRRDRLFSLMFTGSGPSRGLD